MNVIKVRSIGTPRELWCGVAGETETERAARLAAAADIYASLSGSSDETDQELALYVGRVAPEIVRSDAVRFASLLVFEGWHGARMYTDRRDIAGRFADMWNARIVIVTARGHYYRSGDPRNERNDLTCRACGASGHFEYIIDRSPCTAPAVPADILRALGTDATPIANIAGSVAA